MERGVLKAPGSHETNDTVADDAEYQAERDATHKLQQKLANGVSGGEGAGHSRGYGELEGYDTRGIVDKRFALKERLASWADVGVFRCSGHGDGVCRAKRRAQRERRGKRNGGDHGVHEKAHGNDDRQDQADCQRQDRASVAPQFRFLCFFRLMEQQRGDEQD